MVFLSCLFELDILQFWRGHQNNSIDYLAMVVKNTHIKGNIGGTASVTANRTANGTANGTDILEAFWLYTVALDPRR